MVTWSVEFHHECERWADGLNEPDGEALLAVIRVLRDQGPTLGRPLVDTVKSSRHQNMKELRPGSTGRTEVRVLFAFDLEREAILLVGGDKSDNWQGWYPERTLPLRTRNYARVKKCMKSWSLMKKLHMLSNAVNIM